MNKEEFVAHDGLHFEDVVVTPNGDSTYKLEFINCKLKHNDENIVCDIVLERVSQKIADAAKNFKDYIPKKFLVTTCVDEANPEKPMMFSIFIPE